jgi:phage-related protein
VNSLYLLQVIDEPAPKPLIWIGSSRKDLREFPEDVRHRMGYALWIAQTGGKHRDAKALSGLVERECWRSLKTIGAIRSAPYTL